MKIPKRANAQILTTEQLTEAAECLKILAHPHRLRIIELLLAGKYSVGELADACMIESHMASGHLNLMKRCGLLTSFREGHTVYYEIAEPCLKEIMDCVWSRFSKD